MRPARASATRFSIIAAVAVTAAVDLARADRAVSAEADSGHPDHHSAVIGLKAAAGGQFGDGMRRFGRGVGIFAEKPIISGWLDLEVVAIAAEVGDEQIYPIDVLAKKPFDLHPSISGYLGVGTSMTLEVSDEQSVWRPGLAAAAGVYVWLDRHWGFDAEVDYNYLLDDGGMHELNVAVGPVLRF
ncbi:MAG: hypothetical protein KJO07_24415 [Deltaproteobacteria bacterium]|nr:hypothetical protein [Deltaproteobacteria bacterium]